MSVLLTFIVVAMVLALVALRRPPRIPGYLPILATAALPQLALLYGLSSGWVPVVTGVCFCSWCWLNRAVAGVPLVGLGFSSNLLAMAVHGGRMPLTTATLAAIGRERPVGEIVNGTKDIVVASSPVWLLGDWIAIPTPLGYLVASPGDVLILLGVLWWLWLSGKQKLAVTELQAGS